MREVLYFLLQVGETPCSGLLYAARHYSMSNLYALVQVALKVYLISEETIRSFLALVHWVWLGCFYGLECIIAILYWNILQQHSQRTACFCSRPCLFFLEAWAKTNTCARWILTESHWWVSECWECWVQPYLHCAAPHIHRSSVNTKKEALIHTVTESEGAEHALFWAYKVLHMEKPFRFQFFQLMM